MVLRLLLAMSLIIEQKERRGEKHLLRLARRDPVGFVLASVAWNPVDMAMDGSCRSTLANVP